MMDWFKDVEHYLCTEVEGLQGQCKEGQCLAGAVTAPRFLHKAAVFFHRGPSIGS